VKGREGEGSVGYIIADLDRAFDTVIEVIDPARGLLVASRRVDQALAFNVGGGRVGRVRSLASGAVVPEIWSLVLHR
jgi:hypothetical protein